MAVNLDSVFHCCKHVAERMRGRGGAIVNISSVDGSLPCLGVGYDVAKAGVNMFTRSLAVDLAPHGIRVNAVAPGYVEVPTLGRIARGELPSIFPEDASDTGLTNPVMSARSSHIPLGRAGTPADIGNAVLFLASDAAAYITGQVLHVDGGWTLV